MRVKIVILSLIVFGCTDLTDQPSDNEFIDNWAFLDNDSLYNELYINDSVLQFRSKYWGFTPSYKYFVSNDSIYFVNENFENPGFDSAYFFGYYSDRNFLIRNLNDSFINITYRIDSSDFSKSFDEREELYWINNGLMTREQIEENKKRAKLYLDSMEIEEEIIPITRKNDDN